MKLLKLILAIVLVNYVLSNAQEKLTKFQIDSIENIIHTEMTKQHIPGLSIAIGIDTNIVWENAYGYSDLENSVKTTTNTKFRTASIGKPMTASAVMQLVAKGIVDLNDSIQVYFPEYPTKRWPITIYQLLTHESGIRSYNENEVANAIHYNNVIEPLKIFEYDSLNFKPGTKFSYTSFNYNLIGAIIQLATKTDYSSYMIKNIFKPALMNNTVIDNNYEIIKNRARGYYYDGENNTLRNADLHDPSDRIPAGGFLTTPEDLIKFAISSYNGKFITKKEFNKMIENPRLPDGSYTQYGMGWGVYEPNDKIDGFTEVIHGGQTPGVSNMLSIFLSPKENICVAIMTNLQGMEHRGGICEQIFRIVKNE